MVQESKRSKLPRVQIPTNNNVLRIYKPPFPRTAHQHSNADRSESTTNTIRSVPRRHPTLSKPTPNVLQSNAVVNEETVKLE